MNGNVYGQYACRITGSILFHSVPYEQKDKSTLEWWEYDKLGTTASLGCVRLKVEDAKWIYNNCIPGTKVEFYSDTNPGPLGKPTAKKITQDESVRNWDPTDPDPNNPWKSYSSNKNQGNTISSEENNMANTNNSANTDNENNVNNTQNNIANEIYQTNEIIDNNIDNNNSYYNANQPNTGSYSDFENSTYQEPVFSDEYGYEGT